ncbi:hypothetical protein PROFUN_08881 [Planoprotostelium fungivorum]|uniref:G8 domain-containing protein n=1 Tax=Planoprotostelium fungivorum TaxID=1890364 RepID=A0A2P6NIR9_9EUKA|nr:hypothetical protein PROFUN_08881 [Planoprotostelium fungivorum]
MRGGFFLVLCILSVHACLDTSGYQKWSAVFPNLAAQSAVNIQPGQNIVLDQTTGIVISANGNLIAGSADCPITQKVVITLCGAPPNPRNLTTLGSETDSWAGVIKYGSKGLIVKVGGSIQLFGWKSGPTWTKLSSTAHAGDRVLHLQDAVSWRAGDQITIASSDYSEYFSVYNKDQNGVRYQSHMTGQGGDFPDQSEYATVASVSDGGKTVTLSSPLRYLHWGVWPETVEVGLLTRNIVVRGDAASDSTFYGGHFLTRSANSQISGVEFTRMGQLTVLGRYPVHFHLIRNAAGAFIIDSSIHTSYQRCIAIHNSDYVIVRNTVSFNSYGHCLFFEDGSEQGNVLDSNLVVWSRPMNDTYLLLHSDNQPSSVWITNPNNTFTNNAVSSAFIGYWWVMPERPKGLSAEEFAKSNVYPRKMACPLFDNNIAHSIFDFGLMIDEMSTPDDVLVSSGWLPQQPTYDYYHDGINQEMSRYTAWRTRKGGMWSRCPTCYWTNNVYAETGQMGTFTLNSQVISDAYFLGNTGNPGTPLPGWDYTLADSYLTIGTPYYRMHGGSMPYDAVRTGGQTVVLNPTFENFTSTPYTESGGMRGSDASAFRLQRNQLIGGKFINSEPVRVRNQTFFTGNPANEMSGYTLLHDGAVDGVNGGGWVVGVNNYWKSRSDCVYRFLGNCYWCSLFPGGITQLTIRISRSDSVVDGTDTNNPVWKAGGYMALYPLGRGNSVENAYFGRSDDGYIANIPAQTSWAVLLMDDKGNSLLSPTSLNVQISGRKGEYFLLAVPYPSGTTFTMFDHYRQVNLPKASSLSALTPQNYFSDDKNLYLWVTNDQANSGVSSQMGILQQGVSSPSPDYSKYGIQITANCPETCTHGPIRVPNDFTPAALTSDAYRADLLPCNVNPAGKEGGNGTVFVQVYPKSFLGTPTLTYQAYHNSGPYALVSLLDDRGVRVAEFSAGTTGASDNIKLSRNVWELLVLGKLYVDVVNRDGSNGLRGQLRATSPSTVRLPGGGNGIDMCRPTYNYAGVYNWTTSTERVLQYDNFGLWNSSYTADQPCGSPVLELQITHGLARVYMFMNQRRSYLPVGQFTALEFYAKFPVDMQATLNVSANGGSFVVVDNRYISDYFINSYQWTLVRIPLSALGVTNLTNLTNLRFGQNSGLYNVNVLIDQVRLVPTATIPTSTLTAAAPQYAPSHCQAASQSTTSPLEGNVIAAAPPVTLRESYGGTHQLDHHPVNCSCGHSSATSLRNYSTLQRCKDRGLPLFQYFFQTSLRFIAVFSSTTNGYQSPEKENKIILFALFLAASLSPNAEDICTYNNDCSGALSEAECWNCVIPQNNTTALFQDVHQYVNFTLNNSPIFVRNCLNFTLHPGYPNASLFIEDSTVTLLGSVNLEELSVSSRSQLTTRSKSPRTFHDGATLYLSFHSAFSSPVTRFNGSVITDDSLSWTGDLFFSGEIIFLSRSSNTIYGPGRWYLQDVRQTYGGPYLYNWPGQIRFHIDVVLSNMTQDSDYYLTFWRANITGSSLNIAECLNCSFINSTISGDVSPQVASDHPASFRGSTITLGGHVHFPYGLVLRNSTVFSLNGSIATGRILDTLNTTLLHHLRHLLPRRTDPLQHDELREYLPEDFSWRAIAPARTVADLIWVQPRLYVTSLVMDQSIDTPPVTLRESYAGTYQLDYLPVNCSCGRFVLFCTIFSSNGSLVYNRTADLPPTISLESAEFTLYTTGACLKDDDYHSNREVVAAAFGRTVLTRLDTRPDDRKPSFSPLGWIIPVSVVGGLFVIIAAFVLVRWLRKRRTTTTLRSTEEDEHGGSDSHRTHDFDNSLDRKRGIKLK